MSNLHINIQEREEEREDFIAVVTFEKKIVMENPLKLDWLVELV